MSHVCDWCGDPIKPHEELSSQWENDHGTDDGNELRTSGCIEPDRSGACIKIMTETPEHYHERCMAAFAVQLIIDDVDALPNRKLSE